MPSVLKLRSPLWPLIAALAGCGGAKSTATAPTTSPPKGASATASDAPNAGSSAQPIASTETNEPSAGTTACGALGCQLVPSAVSAFREILSQEPLVLALGEGHAQKGTEGIASATRRFTESFLPILKDKASDIVIELWLPDPTCNKQVEQVREQQKPVTDSQAKTNKSDFTILAEEANKLGIVPWPLRPTCAEYDSIAAAGKDALPRMLELTAQMAQRTVERCLARNASKGTKKMVVVYGGAMHNDLVPAPGRDAWTFGPQLAKRTNGRYVELDLFVPESILDTESWRLLPWHSHYDRSQRRTQATSFHPYPKSWVLIFPHSGM